MYQHTKIVATIWPASQSYEMISQLVDAWLTAVRMNFSHGDHPYHQKTIELTRQVEQEKNIFIPVVLDTKGPEIRTGKLIDSQPVTITIGQQVVVTTEDILGDAQTLAISYKSLVHDMKPGMMIMIADGLLRLEVTEVRTVDVVCVARNTATIGERKNVNLPGVIVQLPAMSEQDKKDLIFGCEQNVDFVAASFIRKASDVREIKAYLAEHGGKHIKIIAKIENQEWIDNFEEILKETDGVMVARGDLGVDIPLERIPLVQKMMIKRCNEVGKPVITATQMLESMIKNPRPTRAEVTDIANAILDGTDAVMLSGETAGGDYPLESVITMRRVIDEIHSNTLTSQIISDADTPMMAQDYQLTYAIAKGAIQTAETIQADLIFVASVAWTTVRALRKYNSIHQPLFVYTPHLQTARQVQLIASVIGASLWTADSYDHLYAWLVAIKSTLSLEKKSGFVLIVGWGSVGGIGVTDFVKVVRM